MLTAKQDQWASQVPNIQIVLQQLDHMFIYIRSIHPSIYTSVQSAPGIFVHNYVRWDFMCRHEKKVQDFVWLENADKCKSNLSYPTTRTPRTVLD